MMDVVVPPQQPTSRTTSSAAYARRNAYSHVCQILAIILWYFKKSFQSVLCRGHIFLPEMCFSAALRYSTTFHVTIVGERSRCNRACSAGREVLPMSDFFCFRQQFSNLVHSNSWHAKILEPPNFDNGEKQLTL